jgi:hypothetical protein
MDTYALYVSAKMIRTIKAENVADAVKQCPEFTNAVIWAAGHGAHQWFGGAAVELIRI